MTADFEAANLFLYALAVQISVGATGLGIELERNHDVGHLLLQFIGLHTAILVKQVVAQCIKGYAAIHGTSVYVNIAHLAGQILGHRALAARAMAIDCNCYFLHNVYDILISSDDVLT